MHAHAVDLANWANLARLGLRVEPSPRDYILKRLLENQGVLTQLAVC